MKFIAHIAAIPLCFLMDSHAIAQKIGDESTDYLVETVLTGLDDPFGLAVRSGVARSGKSKDGFLELYITESGALRVVKYSTGQPDSLSEVIVGFPENLNSQNQFHTTGPLGLLFLSHSHLVVGGGELGLGKDLLRVYRLPADGSVLNAEQMDHSVGPITTGDRGHGGVGYFYGLTKTNDNILFVTSFGDDSQGLILKATVKANRPVDLQPWIATKKLVGTSGPMGITVNPQPKLHYLVSSLIGSVDTPRDSRITFYSPKSGTLALNLATRLHDIVGLAYSPSGELYAVDIAWNAEQDGGVYRLDDALLDGRQVCRPVKIASIYKPTALVFVGKSELYVAALGDSNTVANGDKKPGVLLKITGDL